MGWSGETKSVGQTKYFFLSFALSFLSSRVVVVIIVVSFLFPAYLKRSVRAAAADAGFHDGLARDDLLLRLLGLGPAAGAREQVLPLGQHRSAGCRRRQSPPPCRQGRPVGKPRRARHLGKHPSLSSACCCRRACFSRSSRSSRSPRSSLAGVAAGDLNNPSGVRGRAPGADGLVVAPCSERW